MARPPWERCRAEIGFEFPSDYREFIDCYGGGFFATDSLGGFWVHSPRGEGRYRRDGDGFRGLPDYHVHEIRAAFTYDGAAEDMWDGAPYPVFPDPGGVLAWGDTNLGDVFFWLTEDEDPDRWPVIAWLRGPATAVRFEYGMAQFLLRLFRGDLLNGAWSGADLTWTMTSDWERFGLAISAGPRPQ